jgi:hypothetical protein
VSANEAKRPGNGIEVGQTADGSGNRIDNIAASDTQQALNKAED